jgi:lipase ATG15
MIIRYLLFLLGITATLKQQQQQPFSSNDLVSLQSIYSQNQSQLFKLLSVQSEHAVRIKAVLGMTWTLNNQLRKVWSRQRRTLRIRNMPEWPFYPTPYLLPDVKDYDTVLSLAEMSYNAYTDLNTSNDWYDLGNDWNIVSKKKASSKL